MKKLFFFITSMFLLNSCAETFALLGPASSAFGGGNVVQSSVSSAVTYGIKKQTGKSPMEHALAYAEEKNPKKEKKRCISFIEQTNSEACMIVNKQIALTQTTLVKKISSTQAFIKEKKQFFLEKAFTVKNKTSNTIKPKKPSKNLVSEIRAKIKEYDDRWLNRIVKSNNKYLHQ